MATNSVKGSNLTKFDNGGSGDNIIGDGYIKTVEKVWLDNYTLTSVITLTNTTIAIATLPENKKLTSIEVVIETTASQTSGTVALGFTTDADAAAWGTLMAPTDITHNLTTTTISWPGVGVVNNLNANNGVPKIAGFQKVISGTQCTVAIKLNNWTMSSGTLKTIVRYT